VRFRIALIPFRTCGIALVLALCAGFWLAAACAPRYREARLLALLRPLSDERTDLLEGSHVRLGFDNVNSSPLYLTDDRRMSAMSNYPALIARIRALHPEIHSDIRDHMAKGMENEIGYHRAAIDFEKASQAMSSLAYDSCPHENGLFETDSLDKDLGVSPPLRPACGQLHAAKLQLAQATANLVKKSAQVHREYASISQSDPTQTFWTRLTEEFYFSKIGDWLKAPRKECDNGKIDYPPLDLKTIVKQGGLEEYGTKQYVAFEQHARENLGKLPCVCGEKDP
jgi:hypothetical protein